MYFLLNIELLNHDALERVYSLNQKENSINLSEMCRQ